MPAIDFTTAFGRLLRDGSLRDAFAANPRAVVGGLNLVEAHRPAFLQLVPEEVEFQARVLLRKRFELVRQLVPETCRRLIEQGWVDFHEYARVHWPCETDAAAADAFGFCRQLEQTKAESVLPAEWNRVRFLQTNRRVAIYVTRRTTARSHAKATLQILLRARGQRWHEFQFFLGL